MLLSSVELKREKEVLLVSLFKLKGLEQISPRYRLKHEKVVSIVRKKNQPLWFFTNLGGQFSLSGRMLCSWKKAEHPVLFGKVDAVGVDITGREFWFADGTVYENLQTEFRKAKWDRFEGKYSKAAVSNNRGILLLEENDGARITRFGYWSAGTFYSGLKNIVAVHF